MAIELTWEEEVTKDRNGAPLEHHSDPLCGEDFRLPTYFTFFLTAAGESAPFLGKG